jgi:molybdopterin molybdotransferase
MGTKDEGLVPVEEARSRLLALLPPPELELVPMDEALGRALAETVVARRTLPPWDNSAMDGYALRAEDVRAEDVRADAVRAEPVPPEGRRLRVVATVHAGDEPSRRIGPGECARIMTGAPLPPGADAVVMQERTERESETWVRILESAPAGQHVRRRGEETREGEALLPAGTPLGIPEAGLLWGQGLGRVRVPRRPRVAILSTGDELCGVDEEPRGRIVDVNAPSLAAAVRRAGGEATVLGRARDTLEDVREHLLRAEGADVVLTSAGVSVGDRDMVRPALESLGVKLDLWRVALRPGKPLLVGHRGRTLYLGLPGNPTSSLVTFELFVRPALRRLLGHQAVEPERVPGRLLTAFRKAQGLAHYVRVRAEWREGTLWATPLATQSSGALRSAAGATHLLQVPAPVSTLAEGADVELLPLSWRG